MLTSIYFFYFVSCSGCPYVLQLYYIHSNWSDWPKFSKEENEHVKYNYQSRGKKENHWWYVYEGRFLNLALISNSCLKSALLFGLRICRLHPHPLYTWWWGFQLPLLPGSPSFFPDKNLKTFLCISVKFDLSQNYFDGKFWQGTAHTYIITHTHIHIYIYIYIYIYIWQLFVLKDWVSTLISISLHKVVLETGSFPFIL